MGGGGFEGWGVSVNSSGHLIGRLIYKLIWGAGRTGHVKSPKKHNKDFFLPETIYAAPEKYTRYVNDPTGRTEIS